MSEQIKLFIKEVEEAKILLENELSIELTFLNIQLALEKTTRLRS
jgi:hypothetical protein